MPTISLKINNHPLIVDYYFEVGQKTARDRRGFDEEIEERIEIQSIEVWGADGKLHLIDGWGFVFGEKFLSGVMKEIKREIEERNIERLERERKNEWTGKN